MLPELPPSWQSALQSETRKPYFTQLARTILQAYQTTTVYPPLEHLFQAFITTPLPSVRVVILGQDPYHDAGQAHGLAFSVPEEQPLPPSLCNVFKEIEHDLGQSFQRSGNLTRWATQGVLLLNTTLTVTAHQPGSHHGLGWELFTDAVIATISRKQTHVVFMLWGKPAATKAALIDHSKHLVLHAPHPSPLSAYRGFFGCKHFSTCNDYLTQHGKNPIVG